MNVAVLGIGSIGRRHSRNLVDLGVSVIGYDPDPRSLEELTRLGAEPAASRNEAIERADVVVIATPNGHHRDDLDAVVAAKRHVFIEKPLAATTDGLEPILKTADKQNLVVFAGMNLRHHPCVRKTKEILNAGRLGAVLWGRFLMSSYLPDWRPHQDYRKGEGAHPETGGAMFDLVHELDLAWHLLGSYEVSAAFARTTGTLEITSDDCVDVIVTHVSGVKTSIHSDYVTRPRRRAYEIAGTHGVLSVDMDRRTLCLESTKGEILTNLAFEGDPSDIYIAEIRHFMDCVRDHKTKPLCDGMEALSILRRVIDARSMSGLPSI